MYKVFTNTFTFALKNDLTIIATLHKRYVYSEVPCHLFYGKVISFSFYTEQQTNFRSKPFRYKFKNNGKTAIRTAIAVGAVTSELFRCILDWTNTMKSY